MKVHQLLVKPVTIVGHVVTERQIRATFRTVRGPEGFTSDDLRHDLSRAGVTWEIVSEASNRLLQRFRKLGLVHFRHGYWWPLRGELDRILASADRSGEADETSTKIEGSAEGESAVTAATPTADAQ